MPLMILGKDDDDYELLSAGYKNRRIGFPVGMTFPPGKKEVFERAVVSDWLRLIDVEIVNTQQGQAMIRVYYITDGGMARANEIKTKRFIDGKVTT